MHEPIILLNEAGVRDVLGIGCDIDEVFKVFAFVKVGGAHEGCAWVALVD